MNPSRVMSASEMQYHLDALKSELADIKRILESLVPPKQADRFSINVDIPAHIKSACPECGHDSPNFLGSCQYFRCLCDGLYHEAH